MSAAVTLTRIQPVLKSVPMNENIFVASQNEEKQFNANAIRRLIRKLDRRLLPFLILLEIGSVLNRASTAHAKLMNIQTDLNISDSENRWSSRSYYISRVLFIIPSNLLLRVIGSSGYLTLSMLAWGSLTIGMAFIINAQQFIIIRFFLGMAEAGYFPCMVTYFSYWYPKRDQIWRIALLYSGALVSRILSAVLAYTMGRMAGIGGLQSWRWMFLLEGSPIIPLGIITYIFLDSVPNAVQWLNNIEKQLLTNLLRHDASIADHDLTLNSPVSWRQVRFVFIDWQIYLYGLINFGNAIVLLSLTTLLPALIKTTSNSQTTAHLVTIPFYTVGCICCLLVNYSSSRRNEHGYHVIFCLLVSLSGCILMLTLFEKGNVAIYISTGLTLCGVFPTFPLLLSWLTNNIGGHTKRTMAISFVIGIGEMSGIFIPEIYREVDKPVYRHGHMICSAMILVSLISTIILRFCLSKENDRRTNLSSEEHRREAAMAEPCDRHPNVRYKL